MNISIRILTPDEWPLAFEVINQLRPALSLEEYLQKTAIMVKDYQFVLAAAFEDTGRVVGAVGYRPLCTYSRGFHVHVDDLVTLDSARRHKVGTQLLAFAEAHARGIGMDWLTLDARPGTEPFYHAVGFEKMPPSPMRRKIEKHM